MKRHSSLIPLSRDHHHGLVLAQRLKRGRGKAPRAGWPADPRLQRDQVLAFFAAELVPHFSAEEELVFPLALEYLEDGSSLVSRLLEEHEKIRTSVQRLEGLEPGDLKAALGALGQLLEEHIRREERVLFEALQEQVPEARLRSCGTRIRRSRRDLSRPAGSSQDQSVCNLDLRSGSKDRNR